LTDITTRLRLRVLEGDYGILREAAEEIERLRDRLELRHINDTWEPDVLAIEVQRLRKRIAELTGTKSGEIS